MSTPTRIKRLWNRMRTAQTPQDRGVDAVAVARMTSTRSYGATQNIQLVSKSTLILLGTYFRIPVSSRSFDHRTASRLLLEDNVSNGTSYFNKGFYRKII